MSVITEFFADDVKQRFSECKGMFENVIRSCDEQFKVASSKCQEQFQTIKTLVADLQSFNFEDQIMKLKDEIIRLTSQLHSRLIMSAPQLSVLAPSTQDNSSEMAVSPAEVPCISQIVAPQALAEPQSNDIAPLYPQLGVDAEKSSSDSLSLPPDAALRDLSLLEGMGFLSRRRNLDLLAKHKGDVVAVVEDLLAEEQ